MNILTRNNNLRFFDFRTQLYFYSVFLFVGTLFFRFNDFDLRFTSQWHDPATENGWPMQSQPFWEVLYKVGVIPSLLACLFSLIMIIRSYLKDGRILQRYRAWSVLFAILLGPGIIINGILKPHYGRPRPYDLNLFGGNNDFLPILTPGPGGESFPCGHCSAGFVLTIFFYILYSSHPLKAWFSWFFALALGGSMGFMRVAQGGHFPSDVFWSFGITQIVNLFVYYKIFKIPEKETIKDWGTFSPPSPRKRSLLYFIMVAVCFLFVFGFAIATPVTFYRHGTVAIDANIEKLIVEADLVEEDIQIFQTTDRAVGYDFLVLGHGIPWYRITPSVHVKKEGNTMSYSFHIERIGLFGEYGGRVKFFLPKHIKYVEKLNTAKGSKIFK